MSRFPEHFSTDFSQELVNAKIEYQTSRNLIIPTIHERSNGGNSKIGEFRATHF